MNINEQRLFVYIKKLPSYQQVLIYLFIFFIKNFKLKNKIKVC